MAKLDLSIGQRLAVGFGTVLMLLAILVSFSLYESHRVETLERRLSQLIGPRADAAHAIQQANLRQAVAARSFVLSPAPQLLSEYERAREEGSVALDRLQSLPKDPDGQAIFAPIPALAARYDETADRFVELAGRNVSLAERRAAERELGEIRAGLISRTQQFLDLQVRKRQVAHAELLEMQIVSSRIFVILTLLMFGIGVTTAASTVHAVRAPVVRLLKVTTALEAGDFGEALALQKKGPEEGLAAGKPRDELTALSRAVAHMAVILQRREQRLEADAAVSAALAASIDLEAISSEALAQIVGHAQCELGAIYLRGAEPETLQRVAGYALDGAAPWLRVGEGVPGQAVARKAPVVVRGIPKDAPFQLRFGFEDVPPRTIAAVPLLFQGEAHGVILLGSVRDLPEETLRFVEQSARSLAVSLQNAATHAEVSRLAAELQDKNEELEAQNEELQAQSEEIQAQNEEIQAQNEELHNLTDEVHSQNEHLQHVAEQLAEADRQKEQFLAMLGHELRNPMAAIRNAVAVLRAASPQTPAWARALNVIERQLRHEGRIVDDLLDVSRINRGKIELQRQPVDLVRVVREASQDFGPAARDAGLAWQVELPEMPVWVHGDPTRLAQVVTNFISNAIKYNREGGKVTVRVAETAGMRVTVSVRDTGIGIAPEVLPRVWDAFVQDRRSLDRSQGGLGLGLALVRGLVELHQGQVEVRSDGLGCGSEFCFHLPVVTAPEAPSAPQPDKPAVVSSDRPVSLKILVIEDNVDAAETLQDLLELNGHQVELAATGDEGVALAATVRPHVILCDIGLPGMDGYAVAGQLRANPETAELPIIALSGYGQAEDRRRAREAGFDQHLVKPIDPEELGRLLAALPVGPSNA